MFAPALPAKTSNVLQAEADAIDGVNFPVRGAADREPFLKLFRSAPLILDVIDYENQPIDCRKGIWDAIDDYDLDGTSTPTYPPDSNYPTGGDIHGMPPGYDRDNVSGTAPPFYYRAEGDQSDVTIGRDDAIATFGAKVAHSLYHEIQKTFPWRIIEYSERDMQALLDPDLIFGWGLDPATGSVESVSWDLSETHGYAARLSDETIDFIPQEAFDLAMTYIGTPVSALDAMANIQDNLLNQFWHVGGGDPRWAIKVGDLTYPVSTDDWISRSGCHSAASICCALARSINIPAIKDELYWAGTGHGTVHFPTINRTWAHGDDIYSTDTMPQRRGMAYAVNYTDFVANVVPEGRGYSPDKFSGAGARREFARIFYLNGLNQPQADCRYVIQNGYSRDYVHSQFEFYFDLPTEQAIYDQVWETSVSYFGQPSGSKYTYGRMEIINIPADKQFSMNPPHIPNSPTSDLPWEGEFKSTARVGEYTIQWPDDEPGKIVPPNTVFTVVEGQTTTIDGVPLYANPDSINIYDDGGSANFQIFPNPSTGSGSVLGQAPWTYNSALPGDYTITWFDDRVGEDPSPIGEGPTTLSAGEAIFFGPPNYVPE